MEIFSVDVLLYVFDTTIYLFPFCMVKQEKNMINEFTLAEYFLQAK